MALTGAQERAFKGALRSAYPTYSRLRIMVREELDRELNEFATASEGTIIATQQLVDEAQANGWLENLVIGAVRANPGNPDLCEFYEDTWLALGAPSSRALKRQFEVMARPGEDLQELDPWIDRLLAVGPTVCCIEIPANRDPPLKGTGFLIGPDTIMTNYHIMEAVILGEQGRQTSEDSAIGPGWSARAADVRVRFDFKVLPDGSTINRGTIHRLKPGAMAGWLVDQSPISRFDLLENGRDPGPEELDYAVLKLDGAAGNDVVGGGPRARQRKWLSLASVPATPLSDEAPIVILQHPEGTPIKLAFHAVVGRNGSGNRILYKANTKAGSSGSPCFNYRWDLVALHHHLGEEGDQWRRNQGVPMAAIASLMKTRGTLPH